MTRINLLILLALVGSSIYLVRVSYESRRLFAELDRAQSEARQLDIEHERLKAEKQSQATPLHVERVARDRLPRLMELEADRMTGMRCADAVGHAHGARTRPGQAGDQPQGGGFSATRGPKQRNEFAARDLQIERTERGHAIVIDLGDGAKAHCYRFGFGQCGARHHAYFFGRRSRPTALLMKRSV
jgi:cell division protein FtsL